MDNYSFIRQSELEIASKVNLLSKRIRSQEQGKDLTVGSAEYFF